jgi:RNA polymerase sigma-70 factor (ECF subfamily)
VGAIPTAASSSFVVFKPSFDLALWVLEPGWLALSPLVHPSSGSAVGGSRARRRRRPRRSGASTVRVLDWLASVDGSPRRRSPGSTAERDMPVPEDDRSLARRAAAGDRRGLDELLDRHADRIHAVCRRILFDPEDALDATQEAMIAIARGIGRFDGRSAFTTWLYRVAANAALDELRRKRRRPPPSGGVADHGSASPGVDEAVSARLDVEAALAVLPDDFRVAVVLRDLCDLDYAEIATVLGVPAGTVRSRIARGRAALREQLGNPMQAGERPRSDDE